MEIVELILIYLVINWLIDLLNSNQNPSATKPEPYLTNWAVAGQLNYGGWTKTTNWTNTAAAVIPLTDNQDDAEAEEEDEGMSLRLHINKLTAMFISHENHNNLLPVCV